MHETPGNPLNLSNYNQTFILFYIKYKTINRKIYSFHLPDVSLSAQRAADPDKVL